MADYTFTIKTPAELTGVEKAITRFEQLRGQAQANGEEFSELDKKIARAKASIEAYKTSVAAVAAPAAKVADESERYAAALDKMDKAAHEARASEAQRQIDLRSTAVQTQQAGEKTVEVNKQIGKAVEDQETKVTGLNKALGLLARVGGETGRQIHSLYQLSGSALTIGIAGAAVAISSIISRWQAWRAEIAATKAQLENIEWSKFNSIVTGLKNATIDLNKFNTAVRNAGKPDDTVKQLFDERLAVLNAEIEKKKSLLSVNEKLEISELNLQTQKRLSATEDIKNDKERKRQQDSIRKEGENIEKQIRARYGSVRAGLETDADRKTLQELENQLAIRAGNAPGLRATAEGTKRIAVDEKKSPIAAEAAAMVEHLGGKEGLVEKLRAEAASAQESADSWSVMDLFGGENRYFEKQRIKKAEEAQAKLEKAAAELAIWENLQQTLEMNQADLDTGASDAFSRFQQNEEAMTLLRQEISKRRRVDPINESRRANESMFGQQGNPDADQFLLAVAGAHNINHGERATPQQAEAFNQVAKVQGFSQSNLEQLIKILDGLFHDQASLSQALKRYEQRVEQFMRDSDSRLRDSYNQ